MLEINLLPWRESLERKKRRAQGIAIFLALVLSVLLTLLMQAFLLHQIQGLKDQLQTLEQGLVRVNHGLEQVQKVYQDIQYQSLPGEDLAGLLKSQKQIIEAYRSWQAKGSPELTWREWQYEHGSWLLQGSAPRLELILNLEQDLKKQFKEKQFSLRKNKGGYPFQLGIEPE